MQQVQQQVRNGVALLTLDRPPGNALAPSLRAELLERLTAACADPAVRAIVLTGAGAGFSAGVDLAELDAPLAAPGVDALCNAIETAPKPVVAALAGAALSAGVELALAAHARVARRGARIALPEVTVGLIPGGGGTQRLPRLVGAQVSAELMLTGHAVDVSDPRLGRLFDRIVAREPVAAAIDLAASLAERGGWRRTRDRTGGLSDPVTYLSSLADVVAQLGFRGGAETDIVACLEAALLLPFEQGLAFEAARFQDRLSSPDARGTRHAFAAERRAAAMPKTLVGRAHRVDMAGILGGGALAADLAGMCLAQGWSVRVLAEDAAAGAAVLGRVRDVLDRAVVAGGLDAGARDHRLARLAALAGPAGLSAADLVLDTGTPALRAPVPLKPGVVWALLDDELPAESRAQQAGAQGRVARLRIPRPAAASRLIEVAAPAGVPADLAATLLHAFSGRARSVVLSAGQAGFVLDTLTAAYQGAALVMLAAGVPAARIEAAATGLGFARGPLRQIDETGAYRSLSRLRRVIEARRMPLRPLRLLSDRIADAAAAPERALAFHRPAGQALEPDPGLAAWVAEWREDHPDRALSWPEVEPAAALDAALVNEAARLVEEGAVARASDLDLVVVKGIGLDRRRGGPLFQADQNRLLGPVRTMARLRGLDAPLWQTRPLLEDMVKNGRLFFQAPAS